MSSRVSLGGTSTNPAAYGARNTGADLLKILPPDPHGLSARALLKRGYFSQALIDSAAVLFCFLFVLSVALSIPFALFLLLFARF